MLHQGSLTSLHHRADVPSLEREASQVSPPIVEAVTGARIAIAGGGTGGHLVPGVSLAKALLDHCSDAELVFYTTGRELEDRVIGGAGFRSQPLPATPLPKNPLALPRAVFNVGRGVVGAWSALKRDDPEVVIALGGFGAAAPALAARMRGVPLVLLEQNVTPGRANRCLAPLANEIHLQWKEASGTLWTRGRTFTTGSPLRHGVVEAGRPDVNRGEAYERFGLEPSRVTLLVTGGSQGAVTLNNHVTQAVASLSPATRQNLQVIHLVGGSSSVADTEAVYRTLDLPYRVFDFLDDMPMAYRIADFAIARAGGTTLAELAGAGIPAVLIPYPFASNQHQHANAAVFARSGAGVVLDQSGLHPARLAHELEAILNDTLRRLNMCHAAYGLGRPDAASQIACAVLDLVARRRAQ